MYRRTRMCLSLFDTVVVSSRSNPLDFDRQLKENKTKVRFQENFNFLEKFCDFSLLDIGRLDKDGMVYGH